MNIRGWEIHIVNLGKRSLLSPKNPKKQTSQVNDFSAFLWADARVWVH